MPNLRHRQRRDETGDDQGGRGDHDPTQSEAVHEGRRERAEQSEEEKTQRQRRGDLRIVPAELALQRDAISTPGVPIARPAVQTSMVRKVTATTTQP